MRRMLSAVALCLAVSSLSAAQQFDFPESTATDPAALAKAMPALAAQVIASYKEPDREKYLDNLFRAQIVAGQYGDALQSIAELREKVKAEHPARAAWMNVQYEIYARAKMKETADKVPFNDAYAQAFRDAFARLDDRTSSLVLRGITIIGPSDFQPDLQNDLEKQKAKTTIALADALKLVTDYQATEAFRVFASLDPPLVGEDDNRRYITEKDIRVKTPDGATVCGLIVRPRRLQRLPTLLKFTIYVDANDNMSDARQAAANEYAGVIGFTRGKACSPDKPIPYIYDGADSAALIDWIAEQPWSDGRVGMYGGSYEGFTQWATTKHMPKALKAIMTGAPAAPAIDVPTEGNVCWNFIYPWPFYTTNAKGADDTTYNDSKRWQKLNHDWYVSGRAYRDLDKIDGTPNPIFDEWISHPSYDAYWQGMIPYKNEFARINLPALITLGYYYGGPGAGVYYFSQHEKYNPAAEHYLLIGPYHHFGGQFGVVSLLGKVFDSISGMKLDPVALIDITEMRYEWFDYVFKAGPKPALLQGRVNYQVTGANIWKHAPTLAAMADRKLRFHLSAVRSGDAYRFSERNLADDSFVELKVNFADRSDVDRKSPGGGVLDNAVDTWNGLEFVSDPLPKPIEVSGLFSGHLDFIANKKDFDFEIDLYEQTPKGEYVQLAPYWSRASYVGDLERRHLLTPGQRQRLDFESVRLMSRQLQAGSRVVAVLSVIKDPGRQINYGTGNNVSDETIADAKEPLQIRWFSGSYIDLPAGK